MRQIDTTLIYGGGLPSDYSEGIIRHRWDKTILATIKHPKLMPLAEDTLDRINWLFVNKEITDNLIIMESLIASIGLMFNDLLEKENG